MDGKVFVGNVTCKRCRILIRVIMAACAG